MTPERWQQVKTILQAALELPPDARANYLSESCGTDAGLRSEVESLLALEGDSGQFLSQASADSAEPQWREENLAGRRVGAYRIVREVGAGGMGAVYLAERADEFQQKVALKLIRGGMNSRLVASRFRHERQILAGLDHPNIARLLDGGATEEGWPYFVMEYVDGVPIHRYCGSHSLTIRQRLELFRHVCSAVQYAHQNLIVHRDIKPGNILVAADGTPKLLDFGIAKLLRSESRGETATLTQTGAPMMTPFYASPEQIRGEPVTTATDVYSLGVVLYELVAGRLPYAVADRPTLGILRAICEEEVPRPSTIVRGQVAGEVDAIVLKALEKEPKNRYSSVEQFSEDIRNHLEGLPVLARPQTLAYRAVKFARRNRVAVASAILIVISLVAGLVGTAWQARRAGRRFNDVRRLTNSFLFEFHDKIKDLPGATEARRLVVAKALEYLDSLERESAGDTALELELAEGYVRLGDVQGNPYSSNIGDPAAALASYDKAIRIASAVAAHHARNALAARTLARACQQRADVLGVMGREADSLASVRQAVERYRMLAEQHSGEISVRLDLASSQESLGDVQGHPALAGTENFDAARKSYHASLETLRQVLAREPGNPRAIRGIAVLTMKLGDLEAGVERLDAARALYTQALEQIQRTDLSNHENLRVAASIRGKLAYVLSYTDLEAGLEEMRRGLEGYRQIVAADPKNARARMDLAIALRHTGEIQENLEGQIASAIESYREALAQVLELEQTQPADMRRKELIAEMHLRIGYWLAESGRNDEAAAAASRGLEMAKGLAERDGASPRNHSFYAEALLRARPEWLRSPGVALRFAQLASDSAGGKNPGYLDLMAEAHYQVGRTTTAIDIEEKAIALLPPESAARAQLERHLKRYRGDGR